MINKRRKVNEENKEESSVSSLFTIFFFSRILAIFMIIPIVSLLWNRKSQISDETAWVDRISQILQSFDVQHFLRIAQKGYQYEVNHAFFPLFPYILHKLEKFTHMDIVIVGSLYQLIISFLNSILIYKLGKTVLKNDKLAYTASVIFIVNHSMIYSIALYSEQTFIFLTLIAFNIFYANVDPTKISYTVQSHQMILAAIIFGIASTCRSTGTLLGIFFGIGFIKKLIEKSNRFFKIYKYLFYLLSCIVIMLLPIGMIILWKPYTMHCETKLDRTNAVPEWCLDEFPNVYHYIERVYWDNKFLSFLERKADHFLTSIPINLMCVYVIFKFISRQGFNFLTFGLFGIKENTDSYKASIYNNPVLLSFCWHFLIMLGLILVFANADINSRVASTSPFYYWVMAQMVQDINEGNGRTIDKILIYLMILHNIIYMCLNLFLFPQELGFV